jgi:hypothetical protein
MNIAARIVKRFLRPLSHPSLMLTRWCARSAKARMLKNRYQPLPAACPEAQVVQRQEPYQAVHRNPASPEPDILGAGSAPLIYKGCQLIGLTGSPFFWFCKKIISGKFEEKRSSFLLLHPFT